MKKSGFRPVYKIIWLSFYSTIILKKKLSVS